MTAVSAAKRRRLLAIELADLGHGQDQRLVRRCARSGSCWPFSMIDEAFARLEAELLLRLSRIRSSMSDQDARPSRSEATNEARPATIALAADASRRGAKVAIAT